ncbi:hypothetical protein GCM10010123_15490 [Pilimelia anulata]|uniref:DUF5753 domain-containing protein n=1 Tax=Pilimelia anulata TaxID=53371 RepID=A0A8J3B8G5_9ACTN|nr:hypothetical protein GCM10010123_15490 [Pilimelia anulata]
MNILPGPFRTPEYMRAAMSFWRDLLGAPDDLTEAVAARQRRAALTLGTGKRVVAVVAESALRSATATTQRTRHSSPTCW